MIQKIIDFVKKHWTIFVLILVVLLFLAWMRVRENKITRITKQLTELKTINTGLNADRVNLELKLNDLQLDYIKISKTNDSLKKVLERSQLALKDLKVKNQAILDSLKTIPPDSIFRRLQAIYINGDNLPLAYPFSGSQIRGIYTTTISQGLLNQEYSLQGKSLNNCLNLNKGFEDAISNLKSQNSNLQENVNKADNQITNYNKQVKVLSRQVNNKSFWIRILMIGTGISTGIAILK